ncbi:MAG: aspartate kinase, partial [Candidatus Methanomethylophilaceae archaeon]|nr:aspartate kinase [Candidatus Methanomethylophilaceae archaeon]
MITVLKFGGTSVGSTEALKRVANIIIAEKDDKVAVVSAMSGITNFLVSALEDKNVDLEDVFFKFEERHMNVAKELFDEEHLALFTKEFNERLDEFKTLVADKENWSDPFFKDNVSSQGERFSSLMLAHLISSMGHKSVALTAETAGVYAVGNPLSGSCDLKKTSIGMGMNVKPILENDIIPIITGFYGINEDGKPLTFGRGGSDYAASAIGNALDADVIEIWTDVDGFMSADPRLVPDAVVIEEMNYSEAGELAYFGAKVLHPRTIEPARMKHIPVKIKN